MSNRSMATIVFMLGVLALLGFLALCSHQQTNTGQSDALVVQPSP